VREWRGWQGIGGRGGKSPQEKSWLRACLCQRTLAHSPVASSQSACSKRATVANVGLVRSYKVSVNKLSHVLVDLEGKKYRQKIDSSVLGLGVFSH